MRRERIKVLYVVSTLRRSGPTTQLLNIIKNIDYNSFKVKVLTLSPEPPDSMIDEFNKNNIHIESLGLNRIQFIFHGKLKIKKIIEQYNPDIIHTSGVRADSVISKLNVTSKHCMTIRNYVYEDYIAKYGNIFGSMLAKNNINAMKKCKYVICCSNSLKFMYEKLISQEVYAIQNGVDTEKYSPLINKKHKNYLRKSLGLPLNKKICLVVGSLIARKDPITIIKAFEKANSDNKAVLVILGDGDLMDDCKNLANNDIILKGNVNNVHEYMKASDVFISSSLSEGLPNSVLEAGSSGLRIILSDIPQHREIFSGKEELVSFFEIKNTDTLADLIYDVINNSNKQESDISDFISSNFSNEIMSEKYQKFYLFMLKNKL